MPDAAAAHVSLDADTLLPISLLSLLIRLRLRCRRLMIAFMLSCRLRHFAADAADVFFAAAIRQLLTPLSRHTIAGIQSR